MAGAVFSRFGALGRAPDSGFWFQGKAVLGRKQTVGRGLICGGGGNFRSGWAAALHSLRSVARVGGTWPGGSGAIPETNFSEAPGHRPGMPVLCEGAFTSPGASKG